MTIADSSHAGNTAPASPPKPREGFNPRKFLANLLLVCGSLLFTFLAAELAMQMLGVEPKTATALNSYFQYDPETGRTGQPNAGMRFATTAFAGYTSHGPDGFRTISKSPVDASTVVWCLGDSGTWGWGVSDGQTYVDRLNELSDDRTVFRNMGVCGFATAQQYLLIRHQLQTHPDQSPRLILLLLCENDLPENVDYHDQDPPRPYYSVHNDDVELRNYPAPLSSMSLRSWLKRNSLAYNHLNFYITMAKRASKNRMETGYADAPPPNPEEQWTALRHGYQQIKQLCDEKNITFRPVFVQEYFFRQGFATPPPVQTFGDQQQARFLATMKELSIDALDITPEVYRFYETHQGTPPRLSFVDDPHFNADGHRLIGDAIWAHLGQSLAAQAH